MYTYHSGTLFFALGKLEHNKDEIGTPAICLINHGKEE
jgi:hypothetical protein